VHADPPTPIHEQAAHVLTLEAAIDWALQNNPELAVARKQRGIAESGVVIARTYPFNPVAGSAVMAIGGPADAAITNRVFNQNTLTQDVEVRGQGKMRRAAASAALSRVEWEIAAQEQHLAVRTMRAFMGHIYQQEKLRVLDEFIRLQEQTTAKVKALVDQGKLRAADLVLARSDEMEARAQRGPRLNQAIAAWHDLRGILGVRTEMLSFAGRLSSFAPDGGVEEWTQVADSRRPDLHASDMAYQEADQRERLEIANRFGNPQIGLKTEYNETRIYFTGGTVQFPLPVFNTRRGEIMQRQAEKAKAFADRQRLEIQIHQQVLAARDRLQQAKTSVQLFESEILPTVRQARDTVDKLFVQGEPGVDLLRSSEMHRRVLRAEDGYLDALWELSQTRTDLAAAVGDFTVAIEEPTPCAALGPPQPAASGP
jgi:cobalt-zinc-cadmium efflux system outer membrane protein